jgi:hypothetical protein
MIVRILGRGTKAAVLEWSSGAVALAEIKIPLPERLDDSVAGDPLVAEVRQAFASFTTQDVKALAAIAGSRGES